MIKLTKLTSDPTQSFDVRTEKGVTIAMVLRFLPRMREWYFDMNGGGLVIENARLANAPNALRAYRKNIDFGLLITSTDGFDPGYLDDFVSDSKNPARVTLCLLNTDDVASIEQDFFNA